MTKLQLIVLTYQILETYHDKCLQLHFSLLMGVKCIFDGLFLLPCCPLFECIPLMFLTVQINTDWFMACMVYSTKTEDVQ